MRKSSFGLFIFFLIVSLIFIASQRSNKTQTLISPIESILLPAQTVSFNLGSFFKNTFSSIVTTFQKDKKIKSLEEENQNLLAKVEEIEKLREENESLQKQIGVSLPNSSKPRLAHILGRGDFIILDIGSLDGLSIGDIVVTKNIVIGKVWKISARKSAVLPINSTKTQIKAKTEKTKAFGVIRGESGNVILDNVTLDEKLEIGDIVLTVGDQDFEGGGFPPDLVIGEIAGIDKNESSLFQRAKIQTPNITNLGVVFVLSQ